MEDNRLVNENEYIREQVKQRPLNRKKLVRRTVITASMAVIFGVLACFTFLVLEPVFSNFLYPEDEPETVRINEDPVEILPEDMVLTEETKEEPEGKPDAEEAKSPKELYMQYTDSINEFASEYGKSLVSITYISTNQDWLGDELRSSEVSSGIIVADNGVELIIISDSLGVLNTESVSVNFVDGYQAEGKIKQKDKKTGLFAIGIPLEDIPDETKAVIKIAELDNSKVNAREALNVIALGSPYGTGSVPAMGVIVSGNGSFSLTDVNLQVISTNIYASARASGVLMTMEGKVIGIIDQSVSSGDAPNLLSAIGISELKKIIERISNGREGVRLGIVGTDVTAEANQSQGVPFGAYVKSVEMNSPAMNAGIQSGDVVIAVDEREISSFGDLSDIIYQHSQGDIITLSISRQGQENYRDISLRIVLDEG